MSSPSKDQFFSNSLWGLDNGDFYYPKITFFTKRATGELFDYYGIVPKEEKIRRSSSL